MSSKNKHSKIRIAALAAIAVLSAAGTTFFLAYAVSHNTSTIENQLKIASSGVRIIEDSADGFGKHEVTFKNEGSDSSKVLLRIAYSETWSKADGTVVSNVVNNSNVVAKNWTTAFASDFVNGCDGWYYYEKTLDPGAEVKVLNSIALSNNSYAKYNYDLSFRFESVQADPAAASALWGETVTVSDDGVATWVLGFCGEDGWNF